MGPQVSYVDNGVTKVRDNGQHTWRINRLTEVVNRILAACAPVGANQLDVILSIHLYVTSTSNMWYAAGTEYAMGENGPFPYEDAYMGLCGSTGNAGASGVDSGYFSCHGIGETEAFLLVQAGVNAYAVVSAKSMAHEPDSYVGTHGFLGYTYRGQAYVSDPSTGRAKISRDYFGDLYTCLSTFRESGVNPNTFLTGWTPFDRREDIVGAANNSAAFNVLRYQAIAPNTSAVSQQLYKITMNPAEHTLTYPINGNPAVAQGPASLYWAVYSTECEALISLTKQ